MRDMEALELLGMSQKELQEAVIARIAKDTIEDRYTEHGAESQFSREVDRLLQKQIDAKIEALFDEHILPNVNEYIEKLTLQETNKWGETKGNKELTFVEYLIQRAEAYLVEPVNYEGKSRAEVRSSYGSWDKTQTRITHMVHKHLHYSISTAMENAVKNANSNIVQGIEEAVKIKLKEVEEKLRVEVKTR